MTRCTQESSVNGGNTGYPVGKQHEQSRAATQGNGPWAGPLSTAVSGGRVEQARVHSEASIRATRPRGEIGLHDQVSIVT